MIFGLSGHSGGLESLSQERLKRMIPQLEEMGYASMWINEEHFQKSDADRNRHGYSPLIYAAAVAAMTSRLRIGFSALLLPLHNPLRLAEEVATLDRLSDGRIEFGISRGHPGRYFEAYGVDPERRTEQFRSVLSAVLRYWQADGAAPEGELTSCAPSPAQQPHPPIYVAAYSDESVRWTAENGHRLILHGIQSVSSVRRCLSVFAESGGDRSTVPVGRFVYVGESDEQAKEDMRPVIAGLTNKLRHIRSERFALIHDEEELEPERFYDRMAIIGGAATVRAKLAQLQSELGIGYVNLLPSFFGLLPEEKLERSLLRFSEAVMPEWKP